MTPQSLVNALENKVLRYWGLITRIHNWPQYLLQKVIGFDDHFQFQLRGFGRVQVPRSRIGTFRECCFDDMYWRHIRKSFLGTRTDPIVIDIGANVGYFAIETYARYPGAKMYCLEPHPYCFRELEQLQRSMPERDLQIYQLAAGESDGNVTLHTLSASDYTALSTAFEGNTEGESFIAKSTRLDTFLQEFDLGEVDFVKIDCEGSEYAVLYALDKKTFSNIRAMAIETHEGNEPAQSRKALSEYLQDVGYSVKTRALGNTGFIWACRRNG